jgi:hypothetical protein
MAVKRNQQNQPDQNQQDDNELKGREGGQAQAIQRQEQANRRDPEQEQADKERGALTSELSEPHTGEPKYFEGTVTKIDKDGNEVMSDHLEEGDRLRRETTDRYKASGLDPAADY